MFQCLSAGSSHERGAPGSGMLARASGGGTRSSAPSQPAYGRAHALGSAARSSALSKDHGPATLRPRWAILLQGGDQIAHLIGLQFAPPPVGPTAHSLSRRRWMGDNRISSCKGSRPDLSSSATVRSSPSSRLQKTHRAITRHSPHHHRRARRPDAANHARHGALWRGGPHLCTLLPLLNPPVAASPPLSPGGGGGSAARSSTIRSTNLRSCGRQVACVRAEAEAVVEVAEADADAADADAADAAAKAEAKAEAKAARHRRRHRRRRQRRTWA